VRASWRVCSITKKALVVLARAFSFEGLMP
jgi:hypothetical protein